MANQRDATTSLDEAGELLAHGRLADTGLTDQHDQRTHDRLRPLSNATGVVAVPAHGRRRVGLSRLGHLL